MNAHAINHSVNHIGNPQLSLNLQSRQPNVDYTVMRSGVRFYNQHCYKIPFPIVTDYFSCYRLLFWSADYVYRNIIEGTITKDGITYQVIYRNGITRGQLLQMIQEDCGNLQIACSFRAPKPEWNLPPVVLLMCGDML